MALQGAGSAPSGPGPSTEWDRRRPSDPYAPSRARTGRDCGGIRLYLGKPERDEFRSNPLIYYRVGSISDAYQTLKSRGVSFRTSPHVVHATESMELWMADFRDPDGNCLCLMSEVAK